MRLNRRWQLALALGLLSSLGSVIVFWSVWRVGISHSAPELEYDTSGAVWTNAWVAHAMAHLENPFFSSNLMHPYGVNLLANAYNVGFSALFAPITWLFNPIVSLNAQLMAIPIANALAMGLCLRRWVRSGWIALACGLTWGFSPFVITALSKGWTNVGFLVSPPIIFWLLMELFEGRTWSPRKVGIALAAVVVIQYFVDSEILVIAVFGALVGVGVVVIQRRSRFREEWARYRQCALWSVVPTVVLLAAPVAYGIFGPHPASNWVRPRATFKLFVSPLLGVIATPTSPTLPPNLRFGLSANTQYLGAGVLLVVLVGLAVLKLPARTRPLLVVGLVGLWISVGYGPWWSPFRLIEMLPVVHNITVTRFIMLTWFAAVVLVALIAQRALDAVRAVPRRGRVAPIVAAGILIVAFAPPLVSMASTLPVSTSSTVGDAALPWVLAHPGHHVIMGFPFPVSTRLMLQQAKLGDFNFATPGGQQPQILDAPEPAHAASALMGAAGYDTLVTAPTAQQISNLLQWMRRWGVTDVIVPRSYEPDYAVDYAGPQQFVAIITEALGRPLVVDGEWVWIRIQPRFAHVVLSQVGWNRCTQVVGGFVDPVPSCVLSFNSSK
jgi:hypothetical protein